MNNMNEFRIEQSSLIQALEQYREMETVLEEERENLQNIISQESSKWQGAAAEAAVSSMNSFLQTGEYNEAYECVRKVRMCMEITLDQVSALLVRCEDFSKQLESDTYIESMRPACGDYTLRNGGVLHLDYGKAMVIPDLCDQISEAAEYLGMVLKQSMEDCRGIIDDIDGYQNRVDAAVRKVKRVENYKLSFQKYVQGIKALENDVAVCLAGMKDESRSSLNDDVYDRKYYKSSTNLKILDAEPHNISINDFKEQITLYRRNSPNSLSYDEICTYLETLYQNDYICKADYENILSYLNSRNRIPTSVENILYENTMKLLSERERIIQELSVQGWSREEIACALQVDILLTHAGFDEEYIMGVIGNVKCEGKYGIFEDPSYSPERMPKHLAHMITCVNYKEKYNGKNITEVDLMQVYYDLYCKSTECESDQHMFGLGSVQWTGDRTDGIIERYLKECGYDINTEEGRKAFEIKLNEYKKALESNDFSNYDGVYINSTQVKRAETRYMVEELMGSYYSVYEDYNLQKSNDENQNIDTATELVMSDYECPSEAHANLEGRKEAAHTWYEVTRE